MKAVLWLAIAAVLAAAVVAESDEDTFTVGGEHVETFLASERTDIIPAGVAAEKPHTNAAAAAVAAVEAVRFAQVDAAAEAKAQEAHVAEMEVDKKKKRARWPPSPDHPGIGRGCWITQTHCIRHPGQYVGTFRDVWGEKNVGSGENEKKCLARAQEYHVYCGNPHTVSTTAKFRNTQRQRSYPRVGCWIHQSTCNRDSAWTGVFRDAWGEKKLGTDSDEKRCLRRAREYAVWCGNPSEVSTMAEFRGSGNTRYYPRDTGCFVSQDVCRNHPNTVSPWPFRDLFGEKNVGAAVKEANCHARAREYHSWCGNEQADFTSVEFRPTGKRAAYPAVDKVQVDKEYAFQKLSWQDSENFCKANGKSLCMRSELCPNGFPLRGRPSGDHWVAVRDMENGWAAIGTAYNNRVCKLHQSIDNGAYGKPTWGFEQYDHPVLCCDDPDEMLWTKSLALSNSISWKDAKKACKAEGFSLCPHTVYCPDGRGNSPAGGVTEGDHWAPAGDYPNAWVSVGDYEKGHRLCRLHDELFGFPTWGTQQSTYAFKGHVRCCAKDNACAKAPCENGGKCTPSNVSPGYKCECKAGFMGATCSTEDKCAAKVCENGGVCRNSGANGAYECQCKPGFSGKNCERVDPCSNEPCKNNARCVNDPKRKGGFRCKCPAGFSGRRCGVRDPCAAKPCGTNGKCIRDSGTEYHCKCRKGFTGRLCNNNVDDCTPAAIKSCKNGGRCVDGVNSYTCDCTGTKFAGPDCSQYPVKGFAQVFSLGRLFVDDDERENDLGRTEIALNTFGLPGGSLEISAKAKKAGRGAIIASFDFKKTRLFTGSDWECSSDDGRTYTRAVVVEGRGLPPRVDTRAQPIWAKDPNALSVNCRVRLPVKNLAPGTKVMLPVKNKISPLCSKAKGSVTYYYGEVCANGGIQWNHMHTRSKRKGLTQDQCAWSRKRMAEYSSWITNWLGSCTEPPKALFPKLPTARASYYSKRLRVVGDACKKAPCAPNALCREAPNGPMPWKCKCKPGFSGDGVSCVEVDNCAQNPCDPNATCRRTGPGQHLCSCKPGFMGTGTKCTAINNCKATPRPCSSRAKCKMTGPGTHLCKCRAGFTGDGVRCKPINNCHKRPRPCDRHALCSPTGPGTHKCTCRAGFLGDGRSCKGINACKNKPCDKNAQCFKTGPNRFRCECKKGYKGNGKQCFEVNMCKAGKPCASDATCTYKGPGKYSCACNKGFEGDGRTCVEVDMCRKSKPCDPNAECTHTGPGTFKCECRSGFEGDGKRCAEVNICKVKNPCSQFARCKKSGPGVASCTCKKGYEGDGAKCSPINKCLESPCDAKAKCRMTGPGRFSCRCKKGWSGNGKICKEFDMCDRKPCDPHSDCYKTGPGKFKCECHEGFKGDGFTCLEINDCDTPSLCNENANCMKTGPGAHKCICKRGFRGDGVHCTEIDPCLDNPCDAKATCKKLGPGQHQCTCLAGYEGDGKTCKPIDLCKQSPCDPRAKCTFKGPGEYECKCTRGHRGNGKRCVEIESCKERPCPSNSLCIRTGPGRHRCRCETGFTWSRALKGCTPINGCKVGPQRCHPNAICESTGPGTVKCTCKPGYEGDGRSCKPIDSCKAGPCGTGELCTRTGPGTHKCSCQRGHRRVNDKQCDPIDRCKEMDPKKPICPPASACAYTAPGKYKCSCAPGYAFNKAGTACKEVNACKSNPCSKWGTCTKTGPGAFSCKCMDGFTGDGVKCTVQPGSKAVMIGGKLQIVPHVKGDKHDTALGVIEAMLGKFASEEPNAVAQAFGGSATSIGAGAQANPTPSGTATGDDVNRLDAVRKRVLTLEATTTALAEAAKRETEELKKLRAQSAADNARVLQALNSKTDSLLGTVTDATHDIMVHTPHPAGAAEPVAIKA